MLLPPLHSSGEEIFCGVSMCSALSKHSFDLCVAILESETYWCGDHYHAVWERGQRRSILEPEIDIDATHLLSNRRSSSMQALWVWLRIRVYYFCCGVYNL
ncbi:hypothetical protein BU25DRAFT_4097 [Macroventuria anomochaeta]|uniref:Uncharacterized protein n=1 Tax=Macroventuria anomochaeta TaxID=301207 RepID=A0ACB6SJD0_9PLEO|nr:uncharacterized protein BU25DRAFT_4097 [Macroventuria anomochaeta]KAF2633337.1 hypothetical protein BU25DRAFT_4097 [Macroventuria anomochaeta]